MASTERRSKIVETVTTPLGFFVLVVLVVEAGLIGLAAAYGQADRLYLASVVFILVLLIVVVALIAVFRPEALSGKRHEPITLELATNLAKEVHMVINGYIEDENKAEAYGMLKDACSTAGDEANIYAQKFAIHFSETIVRQAKILGKINPKGRMRLKDSSD